MFQTYVNETSPVKTYTAVAGSLLFRKFAMVYMQYTLAKSCTT